VQLNPHSYLSETYRLFCRNTWLMLKFFRNQELVHKILIYELDLFLNFLDFLFQAAACFLWSRSVKTFWSVPPQVWFDWISLSKAALCEMWIAATYKSQLYAIDGRTQTVAMYMELRATYYGRGHGRQWHASHICAYEEP
jgi:hypothetical protein